MRQSEAALGSAEMTTLVFRGRGVSTAVGQAYAPADPWPVRQMRSFSRAMNFDDLAYREDFIRSPIAAPEDQDSDPQTLAGPQPDETRGVVLARQAFSWDVVGVANPLTRTGEAVDGYTGATALLAVSGADRGAQAVDVLAAQPFPNAPGAVERALYDAMLEKGFTEMERRYFTQWYE